jgi:hypothetical protein
MNITNKRVLLGVALAMTTMTAALCEQNTSHLARHQRVEGSWSSSASPGQPPALITLLSEGSVIANRPVIVSTPGGPELVSTGHGTWVHTGRNEFSTTVLYLRSGPNVEFTGLVKVNSKLQLDNDSDELSSTGTLEIFDANGNLLISRPISTQYTRIPVEP